MVYITKSASPPPKQEVDFRLLRYQMQSVAKQMIPENRVKICLRYQLEKYGVVDVFKHRNTQKAFYGGLMVCGSVWVCPVCASKISERRRKELKYAYDTHRSRGGYTKMMTLTFSHARSDKLLDLIQAFKQALKRFQSGKNYAKLRNELGYLGTIRAMEITYGDNGWHPHVHLVILHKNKLEPWEMEEYETRFYDLWSIACKSADLVTSRAHGLKLDDADQADQYIAKWGELKSWGIDSEMTKANIKKGRFGSLSPFDFLRLGAEEDNFMFEPQFKEYAAAIKETSLRQLYWSPGLKKQFEIEDKTDEEVAEAKEEEADRLGGLSHTDWMYITRPVDRRAEMLKLIEQHGLDLALIKIGLKKEKDALSNASSDTN